jgi:hypothetical protein
VERSITAGRNGMAMLIQVRAITVRTGAGGRCSARSAILL